MTTPSRPFTLTFSGGWDKGVRYFTRFTEDPEELGEDMGPGLTFTENQDIYIRFDAPRGFRFTMDGLDVVTIPGEERENGQTYIAPFRRQDQPLLLFEGQDFPLVPGYYVLTVEGNGRRWYGLMEITPKYMGKQSWQDMRDELADEIRTLSFDFMKKNIHISKALEGALGLSTYMLLRFYTISSESSVVLNVLDELSHTANTRMVLRLKQIRQEEGRRPDPHIRPQHVKERQGAERMPAFRTEITRDVEENRFAKSILLRLDRILQRFLEEIDGPIRRLEEKQAELRKYTWGLEYRTGEKALSRLSLYRRRARRIRGSIGRVSMAPWFEEAKAEIGGEVPMTVFMDPRYSVLYRLYKTSPIPPRAWTYPASTSSSGNGRINSMKCGASSNSSKPSPPRAGNWKKASPSSAKAAATASPPWSRARKSNSKETAKKCTSPTTASFLQRLPTRTEKTIPSTPITATASRTSDWTTTKAASTTAPWWRTSNTGTSSSYGRTKQEAPASAASSTPTAT